jgi:hypothetical protein
VSRSRTALAPKHQASDHFHGQAREGAVGFPDETPPIPGRRVFHDRGAGPRVPLVCAAYAFRPSEHGKRRLQAIYPSCARLRGCLVADPSSYTVLPSIADFNAFVALRRHDDPKATALHPRHTPRQQSAALASGVGIHSLASYTAITTMQ